MHTSALVSPRETLNKDLAPIGYDIELVGVPREDVAMRSEAEQDPLEAEVPRARWNPENPPVERNNNMKIMDVLSSEVDVLLVSKVV